MSLGHPRWQARSKNGAKQIASRSHGVAGREPRHGELLPARVSAVRCDAIECWGFDGLPRRIGLDYPENCDEAVGRTLEDIDEFARERWFSDCTHASESGCAVKRAIDAGELDPERLELYHALAQESECPAYFRAASREAKPRGEAEPCLLCPVSRESKER